MNQLDPCGDIAGTTWAAAHPAAIADALALLRQSGFLVLEKLEPRERYRAPEAGIALQTGVVLDTEGTGKDELRSRLVELGMVKFTFDPATGHVYQIVDTFDELHDPKVPIEPGATAVNGITDSMVAGKTIDPLVVERFLEGVDVVIAHNAGYDRKLCEREFPCFESTKWGCSFQQIDWQAENLGSAKLEWIAMRRGFHYEAHRAEIDCRVLLHILSMPMNSTGQPALKGLIDRLDTQDYHVWAINAPFDMKDVLNKDMGYRWSPDDKSGGYKAWHVDVASDRLEAEFERLLKFVYRRNAAVAVDTITARERFSGRRQMRMPMRLDHFQQPPAVTVEPEEVAVSPAVTL